MINGHACLDLLFHFEWTILEKQHYYVQTTQTNHLWGFVFKLTYWSRDTKTAIEKNVHWIDMLWRFFLLTLLNLKKTLFLFYSYLKFHFSRYFIVRIWFSFVFFFVCFLKLILRSYIRCFQCLQGSSCQHNSIRVSTAEKDVPQAFSNVSSGWKRNHW